MQSFSSKRVPLLKSQTRRFRRRNILSFGDIVLTEHTVVLPLEGHEALWRKVIVSSLISNPKDGKGILALAEMYRIGR